MAEYIDRQKLIQDIGDSVRFSSRNGVSAEMRGATKIVDRIFSAPIVDVVEVVRCRDCKFATELDAHCELNRKSYKHCSLLRGDETQNVWHKYKKYYKDYSIVELDEFCSYGERKCEE